VLHAFAVAFRVGDGKDDPRDAEQAVEVAVGMAPSDPVPGRPLVLAGTWQQLIYDYFDEVRRAASSTATATSPPPVPVHGASVDSARTALISEAFQFADWAADLAPQGSPVALLPLAPRWSTIAARERRRHMVCTALVSRGRPAPSTTRWHAGCRTRTGPIPAPSSTQHPGHACSTRPPRRGDRRLRAIGATDGFPGTAPVRTRDRLLVRANPRPRRGTLLTCHQRLSTP